MNFEFDLAEKKMQKEKEKRKMELKKKMDEQKRLAMMSQTFEEKEKQKKEQLLKEKIKMQEEIENNGGIYYSVELTPVPLFNSLSSLETDRIKLPPSALENVLIKQDALSASSFSSPILFELSLLDPNNKKKVIHKTHAGVSEFTAEEGTVGIPMKTALSLTQDVGGLNFLESQNGLKILVKYKVLERYPKITATFQPKGYGFHENGEKEISIDLKSTLERVLQNHMVLTQGDVVPLRHKGKTFHLTVKNLEPDTALCIRDTEIEVHFLPSEFTEKEIEHKKNLEKIKKEAQEEEKQLRMKRKEKIKQITLPSLAQKNDMNQPTINIQVRFGNSVSSGPSASSQTSNKIQSPFLKSASLKAIFDWVAVSLIDVEPPIGSLKKQLELGLEYEFQLVYVISPGNKLTLKPIDNYATQSIESYGIKSSSSLFLEYIDSSTEILIPKEQLAMDIEAPKLPSTGASMWKNAFEDAEKRTDEDISNYVSASESSMDSDTPYLLKEEEKNRLINDMRARNVTPFNALMAIQKYPRQLIELENMGFLPDTQTIEMLNKYQGRVERVVNILSEQQSKLLNSQKQVEASLQTDETISEKEMEIDQNPKSSLTSELNEDYQKELDLLHSVGLVDDSRSVILLKKYNRDVEKVINILLS